MDPKQISKQMFDFNKMAFERSFAAMVVMQDQAEKMLNMLLDQNAWMPAEGKKALSDWVKAYKRGREDFKAAMDDNYKKVDAFFAGLEKGKSA